MKVKTKQLIVIGFLFLLSACDESLESEKIENETKVQEGTEVVGEDVKKDEEDKEDKEYEKRISTLEKFFIFEINFDAKDSVRVTATSKEGNANFQYISEIDSHAIEYMDASGIKVGTIIYENYYRYTVDDDLRLKYLFNDSKTSEDEVENEIKQILDESNTSIKELKEVMMQFYEKNK